MHYPFVSIVIPTRNEEKNLPRLLDSITKIDYPPNKLEIIVVDGHSSDKTVEIAKSFKAKIFDNPKITRGTGCQLGVGKAKGELIAFTDADCVVPKNWISGLLKWIVKDKQVAAVGGPNITPAGDSSFAKAVGDVLAVLTSTGSRYGFAGKKAVEIYHNPGCNVLYRKQAIQTVGGFNQQLLTCEDEELDFRLRQKGFQLLFVPWVVVSHYRRGTYKSVFIQAYRFAVGRSQAIRLHWQMARWFHFIPSFLILSLLLAIFLIVASSSFKALAFLYLLAIFSTLAIFSVLLALTKRYASALEYLIIFFCWFLGWGGGLVKGLIGEDEDERQSIQ